MVHLSCAGLCYIRKSVKHAICSTDQSKIQVQGWLRSLRAQKRQVFATINDGLSPEMLQLVLASTPETKGLNVNSFVQVSGTLVATPNRLQPVELKCHSLDMVRPCTGEGYPFPARARPNWQRSRQFPHLRARLPTCASVLRSRAALTRALHAHMEQHNYLHVNTPALTASDCEGAGDVFSATTAAVNDVESESFFGEKVHLTVSGQLHLEAVSSGITHVYTLSPAFRAERSRTRRHLVEFHMLEAELAPARHLSELTQPLERLVRGVTASFLESCSAELPVLQPDTWRQQEEFLQRLASSDFISVTHAEAVAVLSRRADLSDPVRSDGDLSREHELALLDHCGQVPVFVTDWPARIKPFYMRRRGYLACAVDLLVPRVGELAGGSLREDDAELLSTRLASLHLLPSLGWYVELRRFGGPPTAGYGLGFERLLMLLTGLEHVRDVVPFPRWYKHCQV